MRQALARMLATGIPASVRHLVKQPAPNGARSAVSAGRGLRLASYNVHNCVGTDGRYDPHRIGKVIAEVDADIVALQEVDRRFGDRLGLLDLAQLERETGLTPVPIPGLGKSHGWHGNMILTRTARVTGLQQISLPGLEPRGALVADLAFAGDQQLRVIGAHFGLLRQSRRKQARVLADFIAGHGQAAILMGDLNEWRIDGGSPLAHCMTEAVDPRHAPLSFPSGRPLLPLDRIIASDHGSLSNVAVHRSALARVASDHLPITAEWHGSVSS